MAALGLNLLIFLPLLAGIAIWLLPAHREAAAPRLAFVTSLFTLVVAFGLWMQTGVGVLVGETNVPWVALIDGGSGLDIRYHIGLDPLGGPLVLLTALLMPLSIAGSFNGIRHRRKEYYGWLMLLTTAMFGVFVARDILLFYIFFEFTLVPLYFLIGVWGGSERRYAANKFFLYTFLASVFTFTGILYIVIRAGIITGADVISFNFLDIQQSLAAAGGLTSFEQHLLFLALFAGFAVKVPLFPLHTWLPLAHTEAPTAGSVLLAGILLKLGTYGFLRIGMPLVPEGALYWASLMGTLAVAGIIYGALCSWVQVDIKKLVAYSSVSHLGFCMLGMFALIPVGLSGSVLYMINHGISTGALFLIVGMIYERYHTRDMQQLGGLAWKMPVMAFFLILFTLSSIGLPGLNGFVSEFTTLLAAFNSPVLGPVYGSLGALGILLGAIYMLYMVGKILFGPVQEPPHTPDLSTGLRPDLTPREIGILVPLAALTVILGVAPWLVTDTLDPLLRSEVLTLFPNLETAPAVASAAEHALGIDVDPVAPATTLIEAGGR